MSMADCDCNGVEVWDAWHDRMPGTTATLNVVGTCTCPTAGYTVNLERHEPQGINPRDLLLSLVETRPTGAAAEVITPVQVEYRAETEMRYDTVSIVPDGPVGIPVREVS
jgi:hypothetical protein